MGLTVSTHDDGSEFFRSVMAKMGEPLAEEMNRQTLYFIGKIQREQMSGRNGNIHLNVQTGNLRRSWFPKTTIESGGIITRATTNVKYAAIHQYGGVIHRQARQSVLSFHGKRGRFVSPSKKSFSAKPSGQRQQKVHIGSHDIHMPKRLFILEDFAKDMPARYQKAIQKVITGK